MSQTRLVFKIISPIKIIRYYILFIFEVICFIGSKILGYSKSKSPFFLVHSLLAGKTMCGHFQNGSQVLTAMRVTKNSAQVFSTNM